MARVMTPQGRTLTNRHKQLPDQVASYVRELIISGSVRAGEFLRLEPLAEAIGVSVTPVREGMLMLQNESMVRLVPRRGFVVEGFSAQDVRDLFWAQAQLAGELAARAAQHISPELITKLEINLNEYELATEMKDADRLADLGHQFHSIINVAAASPRLAQVLATVVNQLPNRFYASIPGQVHDTKQQHPKLIEALRTRNADEARIIMEQHISEGAEHLTEALAELGIWSSATDENSDEISVAASGPQ